MPSYAEATAFFAGLCGGLVAGAWFPTITELQIRAGLQPQRVNASLDPFQKVGFGAFLRSCASVVLMGCVIAAITLGIQRFSGVSGFRGLLYTIFGFSFLGGVAVGKYSRYLYWRSHD